MRSVILRAFAALTIGAAATAAGGAASAEIEVSDVRMGLHPGQVRVVLESSSKLEVTSFTLAQPYRVVLDMPEVRWRLDNGAGRGGKGFVAGFRYGQFVPGRARMVFDLKVPAVVAKSFAIPPGKGQPWRFVLDLKRVTAAEALARIGQPNGVKAAALGRLASPRAAPTPKKTAKKKIIAIDPGHGGIDPGATGRIKKTIEKTLTLTIARRLKRELERRAGYRAILTRNRDVFVRLRERIARARAAGADLFISLHADSLGDPRVRGASVYTLSERASDKEAAALAAQENKADLIAGIDLSSNSKQVANILIDLAQRETMNHSVRFAQLLVAEMRKSTRFLRKSHRFAGFAVLKAPDVPSVLVEMGYLSNLQDEAQLLRPRYQARLAKAIAKAVDRYFARREQSAAR
ncbi:MAG: N-acetylmuramoyl-L-alanine amidase [Alphaproteobacteria bacterium]|nr:N-acetylmuramoyl-L-alanine amidase [Alphaproteobacteria bacterium]